MPITIQTFGSGTLRLALRAGWRTATATRRLSAAYSLLFVCGGVVILGGLLVRGWTPFVVAAAGAFMLVGPATLAGFFGIAAAYEAGEAVDSSALVGGYRRAAGALWVLSLVCGLLFMIFVTDAAILYAYMVGGTPVWLADLAPVGSGVRRFVVWSAVSGAGIALLLYCVSAFAVPLLCERRAGLVEAVVCSVRAVFGNFIAAMLWGVLLSAVMIGSVLLLPLLPVTLPWLAFASRALYKQVMPPA